MARELFYLTSPVRADIIFLVNMDTNQLIEKMYYLPHAIWD